MPALRVLAVLAIVLREHRRCRWPRAITRASTETLDQSIHFVVAEQRVVIVLCHRSCDQIVEVVPLQLGRLQAALLQRTGVQALRSLPLLVLLCRHGLARQVCRKLLLRAVRR